MENLLKLLILIIILACVITFVDNSKKQELFGSEASNSSEAIQNVASLYNENKLTVGEIVTTDDIIAGKNVTATGNITTSGNVTATGNITATGNGAFKNITATGPIVGDSLAIKNGWGYFGESGKPGSLNIETNSGYNGGGRKDVRLAFGGTLDFWKHGT